MSDGADNHSQEDRELPATERRLQQAREQGQVPRSRELGHGIAALALIPLVLLLGPLLGAGALELVGTGLRFDRAHAFDTQLVTSRLGWLTRDGLLAAAPVLLLLAGGAALSSLAIGGWNVATSALQPDLSRVDPLAGVRRVFSWRQALGQLKVAVAACLLLWVAWLYLSHTAGVIDAAGRGSLAAAVADGFGWLVGGLAALAGVCVLAAVIDVPWTLWQHHAQLRMTREEVRRESKESEGDPGLRAERRRRARERSRVRMMTAVPTADVVVTNPTHYAVALKYDEATMAAPRVVAMGTGHLALRIRELAAEARVPVLEQPPLARALYHHGEVGHEVPVDLYLAVAQVLAWVMQLRRGVRAAQAPQVVVPAGLDPLAGRGAPA